MGENKTSITVGWIILAVVEEDFLRGRKHLDESGSPSGMSVSIEKHFGGW
jgi:hypothetical protein